MILQVFSVFDKAVQLYMPPIHMRSQGEAIRALRLTLRGEHSFAQSPQDYALYHLGAFDEASGKFLPPESSTNPVFVCELATLTEKGE